MHERLSVAVIIAVGVNGDGRREVLGFDIGTFGSRTVLDGVLAKARLGRFAWRQVGDLRSR